MFYIFFLFLLLLLSLCTSILFSLIYWCSCYLVTVRMMIFLLLMVAVVLVVFSFSINFCLITTYKCVKKRPKNIVFASSLSFRLDINFNEFESYVQLLFFNIGFILFNSFCIANDYLSIQWIRHTNNMHAYETWITFPNAIQHAINIKSLERFYIAIV